MKIKLHKALDLLQGSSAVIINNNSDLPLMYANIDEDICLEWDDGDHEYQERIPFDDNETVEISKDCLIFKNNEGEDVVLKLLFPTQLASFCQEGDIV